MMRLLKRLDIEVLSSILYIKALPVEVKARLTLVDLEWIVECLCRLALTLLNSGSGDDVILMKL
jgi:hypothetical protein